MSPVTAAAGVVDVSGLVVLQEEAAAGDVEVLVQMAERAAAAVRAAEQVLHEQLLAAVRGGATWSQLGRALGVRGSALQRRHAPVLGPKPAPKPRPVRGSGWASWSVAPARRLAQQALRVATPTATWGPASAARPVVPSQRPRPLDDAGPGGSVAAPPLLRVVRAVSRVVRRVLVRLRR